jgi:hypothetical protein
MYSAVTGNAATSKRSLSGIETRTGIATRFTIRTVVEILVAKQSSPTLVAYTIPRLDTRTVHATWIAFALVTMRPSVTGMTSVT